MSQITEIRFHDLKTRDRIFQNINIGKVAPIMKQCSQVEQGTCEVFFKDKPKQIINLRKKR